MNDQLPLFNPSRYLHHFAQFDSTGKHRIMLYRYWADGPAATVIGLNPSTADEANDDPTIKSIVRILRYNGYGALYMLNLFTYVTPYPEELKRVAACQYDEKQCIKIWNSYHFGDIVFAWGNFETFGRADLAIAAYEDKALCFGKNANGSPKHPLYLKSTTKLEKF